MADNVLETIQKLVQDVIAPDVRELKARLDGFEKRTDDRFKSIDERFTSLERNLNDRFDSFESRILSAISELKTNNELTYVARSCDLARTHCRA